ncbi:hypothetical protein AAFN60_00940 [Roseibacillus persicicus]|uniref:hypothetical protein n=1 Tax=Roseibacillus persicicus TaxID=454148 RepID=UPI00398A6A0D
MKLTSKLLIPATFLTCGSLSGATINSTGSDGFGASSFNSGGIWGGTAPTAGNDYVVGAGHRMRTPADGGSYTFAGDSLTISDASPSGDLVGLSYKGTGTTGIITVNNLILDNGSINHISGAGDVMNLDGSITVASDSLMYAKQGSINILADISGSATITNPGADGAGRILSFSSTSSTFSGSLVNNGNFLLSDDAVFNFLIGASGINNSMSGSGSTVVDGDFILDLGGASSSPGDSWDLASGASFGSTFTVSGFTDNGDDTWSSGLYSFDESTGLLTVVPEPSAALLGGLGLLTLLRRRSR